MDHQTAKIQAVLLVSRGLPDQRHPADMGLDPGHQLPDGEGLGDVVVRAQVQAQNFVLLLLPGGDNQHRGVFPLVPEELAHLKAVHLRQHEVQQDQVGTLLQGQAEAGDAVKGLQGIIAFFAQVKAEDVHNIFLVLDDEDLLLFLHNATVPLSQVWGASSRKDALRIPAKVFPS